MPKINVAIAERTLTAVRGSESLSRRINQIVDRYLQMLEPYQEGTRDDFDDEEWALMRAAYVESKANEEADVEKARDLLVAKLRSDGGNAAQRIDFLDFADVIGLLELIEADLAKSPTAHS